MSSLLRSLGLAVALGLLLPMPAQSQPAEPIEAVRTAPVAVDGQTLFEVRGTSAIPAESRAERIRANIVAAARDDTADPVAVELRRVEDGFEIWSGGKVLRGIYDADARIEGVDTPVFARSVQARIQQAIVDYRAARSPEGVKRALRVIGVQSLIFAAVLIGIVLLERLVSRSIHRHVDGRVALWEERARNVVQLRAIWTGVRQALRIAFLVSGLIATAVYVNAVLLTLPWTRDIGRGLATVIAEPLLQVWRGILGSIPNLIILGLILAVTVFALRVIQRFFEAIASGRLLLRNFEREWAGPTARLVRVAVIILGLVMAYPYIPGSSSEAFKAISLFIGVALSLGATSIIANMVAGNSLIYRRAFRVGDRVEIVGVLGDVEEITAQATYLRTLKNERVTLPNSLVLGSQVTNYSRLASESGLILHTEVGIGYETPWREVEAMLLEAARRTPGLLDSPAPFVLQKRLGDYAPVYEINGHTSDVKMAPSTYSSLIANIQDVFAERGVQIMTPSYLSDPAEPKIPPVVAVRAKEAG